MEALILQLHSIWAYVTLFAVLAAVIISLKGKFVRDEFHQSYRKIALFGLIATHVQLLLGIALFMIYSIPQIKLVGMPSIMKDATLRLKIIEHPITMIIVAVLITIGFSIHKRKDSDQGKFKSIALFYTIGLILLLTRIPWQQWIG